MQVIANLLMHHFSDFRAISKSNTDNLRKDSLCYRKAVTGTGSPYLKFHAIHFLLQELLLVYFAHLENIHFTIRGEKGNMMDNTSSTSGQPKEMPAVSDLLA